MLLLLLITLSLLTVATNAQDTISFDFSTKKFTETLPELTEGTYQLKIKNINQNLYTISVNGTDTTVDTAAKFPTFADLNLELLEGATKAIGAAVINNTSTIDPKIQIIKTPLFADPILLPVTIDAVDNLEKKLSEIDNKATALFGNVLELANEYNIIRRALIYHNVASKQSGTPPDQVDTKSKLDDVVQLRQDLNEYRLENQRLLQTTNALLAATDSVIAAQKIRLTARKGALEAIRLFLDDTDKKLSLDSIGKLLEQSVQWDNNRARTYTSFPIFLEGDEAEITFSVKPRAGITGQSYSGSIPLKRKQTTYVGTSLSLYIAGLSSDNYSNQSVIEDDSTRYQLVDEENGELEFGVASVLRFGIETKNENIGTHFGIGVGLSVGPKVRPRLLFAPGFALGKRHRLTVDLGGIVGYVDRLSNAVEEDRLYLAPVEDPTVSKLAIGFFGAVGYTFQL